MTLTRLAPPANPVLTPTDLAEHLRLPVASPEVEQTAELTALIAAATAAIERRIDGALIAQGWIWKVTDWRQARELPLAPVMSIESITLIAPDGVEQPWTGWSLTPGPLRPRLTTGPQRSWPKIPHGGYAAIRFIAGFGPDASDIPADLRHAVLMLAAHYFEHREVATHPLTPLPLGVGSLLAPHRPIRL